MLPDGVLNFFLVAICLHSTTEIYMYIGILLIAPQTTQKPSVTNSYVTTESLGMMYQRLLKKVICNLFRGFHIFLSLTDILIVQAFYFLRLVTVISTNSRLTGSFSNQADDTYCKCKHFANDVWYISVPPECTGT